MEHTVVPITLPKETIRAIEKALAQGKRLEIRLRDDGRKVVVWEISSHKVHEAVVS